MAFFELEQKVYYVIKGKVVPCIITKRSVLIDIDIEERTIFYDFEEIDNTDNKYHMAEDDLKSIHHQGVDIIISQNFPVKK